MKTVPRTFSETALHSAAENNYYRVAELLLQYDRMLVDALRGEYERKTALHIAAEHGYPEITKVLLDYNANLLLKAAKNLTVMHFAAKNKCEPVLRMLLEKVNT